MQKLFCVMNRMRALTSKKCTYMMITIDYNQQIVNHVIYDTCCGCWL